MLQVYAKSQIEWNIFYYCSIGTFGKRCTVVCGIGFGLPQDGSRTQRH
jgi:hypothetical protein